MQNQSLEEVARDIFGPEDQASIKRWVDYWQDTKERNDRLLGNFRELLRIDFRGKTVLDIGCGAGGLGQTIGKQCKRYVGGDYKHHVLQFAPAAPNSSFVQCSGTTLPFSNHTFQYIFAFDVFEHLSGGPDWQRTFLRELDRVLSPGGMIFLTTPNFWYPYDAHSNLYFPQYLPPSWRDRYIFRFNPGFLKEHSTFSEIQLPKPSALLRYLRERGLCFLHDLPCCLDRNELLRHHPLWGWLAYIGLGWYPHAEFWGILVREEDRSQLRLELRKNWPRKQDRLLDDIEARIQSAIDFESGSFGHQLTIGWSHHEGDQRGFRWIQRKAVCYLRAPHPVSYVAVSGYSPKENRLEIWLDGVRIGEHFVQAKAPFKAVYLIPCSESSERVFRLELHCDQVTRPAKDRRKLGLMIFSIALEKSV